MRQEHPIHCLQVPGCNSVPACRVFPQCSLGSSRSTQTYLGSILAHREFALRKTTWHGAQSPGDVAISALFGVWSPQCSLKFRTVAPPSSPCKGHFAPAACSHAQSMMCGLFPGPPQAPTDLLWPCRPARPRRFRMLTSSSGHRHLPAPHRQAKPRCSAHHIQRPNPCFISQHAPVNIWRDQMQTQKSPKP